MAEQEKSLLSREHDGKWWVAFTKSTDVDEATTYFSERVGHAPETVREGKIHYFLGPVTKEEWYGVD